MKIEKRKWMWILGAANIALAIFDINIALGKTATLLMLVSVGASSLAGGYCIGAAAWGKLVDEWHDLFQSAHKLNKDLLDEKAKALDVIQNLAPCDECADGTVHTRVSDYVRVHGTSRIRAEAVRRGGYDC